MPAARRNPWPQAACALWITGFLIFFFSQNLPNNSSGDRTVARLDVWLLVFDSFPAILNPFDFSHATARGVESGWNVLPRRWPELGTAIILLMAAWLVGSTVAAAILPAGGLSRCEQFVVQMALGLSLQSLWTLLAGLTGQLSTSIILAPGVIAIPVRVVMAVSRRKPPDAGCVSEESRVSRFDPLPRGLTITVAAVAFPFLLLILLNGTTPPWDFDVREYHLQGPKEWFLAGRIQFLEHNVYTSFPFLSEMLSLDALVLMDEWERGAFAGKQVLACFQLLTGIAVFATGRRYFGSGAGLIAALAWVTVPWTFRISLIAYAEGALTFYLMAAVMSGMLAAETSDPHRRRRLAFTTGLLAGSAMAAKYPGLISVVAPLGLLLAGAGHDRPERIRTAALFGLGVLITVGPWLARNLADTGNPVYPLAWDVFGGRDWSPESNARWKQAHSAPDHNPAAVPAHVLDVVARNDWTSGLSFGLAIPTLLLLRKRREARWLWGLTIWMLVSWWALTHRIDRFWIPILPVVSVLAGAAWTLFDSRPWRGFLITTLLVCSVFHLQFWRTGLVGFQAGLMDLPTARQTRIRPDIRLLNATLPSDACVLTIGEAEVFDADFCLFYNTVFDESLFEKWTADPADSRNGSPNRRMLAPSSVRHAFLERGVTHLYVNWLEILRYRRPGSYGYAGYVTPKRLRQLVDARVLDEPSSLLIEPWELLTQEDQQLIRAWPGSADLIQNDRSWTPIRLYRVTPDPADAP